MTPDEERRRILLTLFPPQHAEDDEDQPTDSVRSLTYDVESLRYVPSRLQDKTDCAICLETVVSDCISGAECNHVYHYDCLMEWMVQDNDNCPEAAYRMLRKSISPTFRASNTNMPNIDVFWGDAASRYMPAGSLREEDSSRDVVRSKKDARFQPCLHTHYFECTS